MPAWFRKVYTTLQALEALTTQPFLFHLLLATINTIRNTFRNVRYTWGRFWWGAHNTWWGANYLGWQIYITFWQLAYGTLPRMRRALAREGIRARQQENLLWRTEWKLYNDSRSYSHSLVLSLTKYVILHILLPLLSLAARVLWYIVNRINPLFDFLLRFLRLDVSIYRLVAGLLEKFAWQAGKDLSVFFFSLFIHNLRRVALLLEDIIVAVL